MAEALIFYAVAGLVIGLFVSAMDDVNFNFRGRCRGGWQPEKCNGECGKGWRDPDAEYERMRDEA